MIELRYLKKGGNKMFVVVKDLTQYVCNYPTLAEAIESLKFESDKGLTIFKLNRNGLPLMQNNLPQA
jgi:hypothetical protein